VNLRLKRTPGLYLVGFMGSGKSTIGRIVADELGWHFIDLDERIERATSMQISELFQARGEAAFREIERAHLQEVVKGIERGHASVVSLGGGAFADEENSQLVRNNGVTVWLDCPLVILERRVARQAHRPLARDVERFRELYEERRPAYARADFRIEVSDAEAGQHAAQILRLPLFR
jgi:shikimate kinase